ncbi:MAG: hypothetical protein ACM3ZA_09365 [Bacillota bacterium]
MSENYEKLFYEEVREKRTAATGVHGLKGKRGLVGKMVTPADVSPRSYKAARDLGSFNVVDFLKRLSEAPGLKSVLLQKMDEEYKSYRLATERTLDAVAELLYIALEPLRDTLQEMDGRLTTLELHLQGAAEGAPQAGQSVAATPRQAEAPGPRRRGRGRGSASPAPTTAAAEPAPGRERKPRIRWGANADEIRQTVRAHARQMLSQGQDLTVSNIQKQVPSMLRYLYGEKAVFEGLKGLIRDLEEGAREAAGL